MRKMPPLPTKKSINNNNKPFMELVSARIALPQRYNSIERVRENKKELFGEEKKEEETTKHDRKVRISTYVEQ